MQNSAYAGTPFVTRENTRHVLAEAIKGKSTRGLTYLIENPPVISQTTRTEVSIALAQALSTTDDIQVQHALVESMDRIISARYGENKYHEAVAKILLNLSVAPDPDIKYRSLRALTTIGKTATPAIGLAVLQALRMAFALTEGRDQASIARVFTDLMKPLYTQHKLLDLKQQEEIFGFIKDVTRCVDPSIQNAALYRLKEAIILCPSQLDNFLELFHKALLSRSDNVTQTTPDPLALYLARSVSKLAVQIDRQRTTPVPPSFKNRLRMLDSLTVFLGDHPQPEVKGEIGLNIFFIRDMLPELEKSCDKVIRSLTNDKDPNVRNSVLDGKAQFDSHAAGKRIPSLRQLEVARTYA